MSSSRVSAVLGRPLAALAVASLALAAGPVAHAQDSTGQSVLEGEPSIRNKQLYLESRHLLLPTFGITINDPYRRNLLGGVSYRYFVSSWLGLGADLFAGTAVDTGLTEQIETSLSTDERAFDLHATSLRFLASAVAEIVPLEGKLMLFGSQLRADFHLSLGIGVASVEGEGAIADDLSVMPSVGIGMRFFPDAWLSVGIDLKDLIVDRVFAAGLDGGVPASQYANTWLFAVSLGFALPPETEVRP